MHAWEKASGAGPLNSSVATAQRLFDKHCALKVMTLGVASAMMRVTSCKSSELQSPPARPLLSRARPQRELDNSMEVKRGRRGCTISTMEEMIDSTSLPLAPTLPSAQSTRMMRREQSSSSAQARSRESKSSKRSSRKSEAAGDGCIFGRSMGVSLLPEASASTNLARRCIAVTNSEGPSLSACCAMTSKVSLTLLTLSSGLRVSASPSEQGVC
mmetsp:Transcript_89258/g.225315  ORF Transcript_89258/g.225315 Transcript_89258/m.225315 type:complete len:214 (-) Transcript_89258:606-1247(-)